MIGCAQRGEALRREAAEWCVMPSFKLFGFGFLCYLCVMRCVLFEILTGLPLILRPPDFFPVLCVCVYCVSATVHTPAWRGGCTVPGPFFPSPWGSGDSGPCLCVCEQRGARFTSRACESRACLCERVRGVMRVLLSSLRPFASCDCENETGYEITADRSDPDVGVSPELTPSGCPRLR